MSPNAKSHYALRYATWCAVLPMAFGTICFLLWLIFQDIIFSTLGLFTIWAAIGLVCVGLIFIILHFILKPKNQGKYKPIIVFFALLLNFPLAWLYISIGMYSIETYTIHIHNESTHEIQNIQILFNQTNELASVDTIQTHSTKIITLHTSKEGSIYYSMKINGDIKQGLLFGYITSGMSGVAYIKISNNLNISVSSSTGIGQSNFFGVFSSTPE